MSKRDYYEVLGLSRDASADQIKKSYRKLALKFHPDKNPGDVEAEEKFKEASEAYQILSDDETRARYDRFGHEAFQGGADGFRDFSGFAEEIFGDIFGAFFGSGGRGGPQSGRDLRYDLEIPLVEAVFGIEKKLSIPRMLHCSGCGGTGAKKGTAPETCAHCGGSGQQRIQQGFFTISRPCPSCDGRGRIIIDPCQNCQGVGLEKTETEVVVKIPAGIDHGQRLRVRGEGEASPDTGGIPGDLYVVISVEPHPYFVREGTELYCEVPMTFSQAVLGGEVMVRTLQGGELELKIPAGTPSGKVFRLKGKGVVDLSSGRRGDQHVRTFVYVPKSVEGRQRELLEELSQIEGTPLSDENEKTFLDRVKDFFE